MTIRYFRKALFRRHATFCLTNEFSIRGIKELERQSDIAHRRIPPITFFWAICSVNNHHLPSGTTNSGVNISHEWHTNWLGDLCKRCLWCRQLGIHIRYRLSKVSFCLGPLDLQRFINIHEANVKKCICERVLLSTWSRVSLSSVWCFFNRGAHLECRRKKSVLHSKWLKHESYSFDKFEASQLWGKKRGRNWSVEKLAEKISETLKYVYLYILIPQLPGQRHPYQQELLPLPVDRCIIVLNPHAAMQKIEKSQGRSFIIPTGLL